MPIYKQLPTTLERYELKYLIPRSYVEPISHFVEAYCDLDYHSANSADHFYAVNSLYFDTPGCEFLKQRLWGRANRFNMRVRTYGDGTRPPYYMEIKQKRNLSIKKYRATATEQEWPNILTDPGFRVDPSQSPAERANKERFLYLATSYAIEPKILTCYRRRAYFSTVDEYARVTMDIELRYRNEDQLCLVPDERMVNYDNENIFVANYQSDTASVVLELKCVMGQVPTWMLDLIMRFQLKQQGFSKYMSSMLTAYGDNSCHFMPRDRQSTVTMSSVEHR
jgi:SPX domain protein involved in polyphosphate accumulation